MNAEQHACARAGSALRRAGAALLLAAAALAAGPTLAQPAPPASPSDPPFWARPRQAAPVCDPANPTGQPAPRQGPSALGTGLTVAGIMFALFLLWRRFQPRPEEPEYLPPAREPTRAPPPPPPAGNGMDPRAARLRPANPPAGKPPAPTTPEEVALADMRTMTIELAQDEPGAESAGAQAFYAEIAASLVAALHKEPERQDLRRKLLEIYFAARQPDAFVSLAHDYLQHNRGRPDQFWPDIGAMGAKLLPEHELFEGFAPGKRPAARRSSQQRRFHERNVDPGRLYGAQQALAGDFDRLRKDASFRNSLHQLLAEAVRRPAPLAASPELSYVADGGQIFIKHEDRRRYHDDDLINAIGQLLIAQRLGRTRVVTATRNGLHAHAVASVAARLSLECHVYITERDLSRHYARVLSMRRLGANIRPIPAGGEETADPRRNALEAWLDDPAKAQYVSGLTGGPSPFPEMVRDFLSVVGAETLEQMQQLTGAPPNIVIAGVADGHLGLGLLQGLLEHRTVELHCVEEKAEPRPADAPPPEDGAPVETLARDTPTRREHHWLRDTRRVQYVQGDEQETMRVIEQYHATGTTLYTQSARTLAYARSLARRRDRKDTIVVLLTGQEGADFRSLGNDW